MSRAWDKENIWVPDGIWTYDLPNSGGEGGALSTWALELRRTHGERGHILGSYLTRVLHTARISKVNVVLCSDDRRADPRPRTVCDVISFSAQRQLCHLTFVGARNLSNHAKASSGPLFANLKILDVFSICSVQVNSFMYLYHNDALPIL